jgi:hypothetical protein
MSTPRRDFLGWMGASSLLAAAGSVLPSQTLGAQEARPVDSKWDMSWTDKLTGKYKAVFDSPDVSEGAALFRACIWRDQHKDVYGTERAETSPVLVIRHEAIELIMNDEYWNRFDTGKQLKLKDSATNKWSKINPVRVAMADAPPAMQAYNLTDFMASGGVVLGCNMAFSTPIAKFQKEDKLSHEDAIKTAREHIIPGIILQPSGIFAVLRAQELGCHYVIAS